MDKLSELTFQKFTELYVLKNYSLQKIGELYGVSRQRVHQIKKQLESKHGKIRRKHAIDSFTLKEMLDNGLSFQEIAKNCGSSVSKISRLVRKYEEDYRRGISPVKIKRRKIKDILAKELLYKLYAIELKNDKEIAQMYGVSQTSVWLLRKEYDIESFYTKSLRR